MERQQKVKLLQAIASGKKSVTELRPPQIIELATAADDPGAYYDRNGKQYTEADVKELIEGLRKFASIVFAETRTYETTEEIKTKFINE